jgi:peptidoglycan hydrolase-like protein with peptidoglycan-binding domain/GH24 family phage-related lysozyme (muramidase)
MHRSGSHGHATAAHDAGPTPGKQTQVQLLSETGHPAHGPHGEAASGHKDAHESGPSVSGVNLAALQHFIGKHEGNVDHVYRDSRGFPTAGIGHLLTGGNYHIGQKVSAEQVAAWFKHDVASAIAGAKRDIGPAYERLDEARRMVVIDMAFNLGTAGFGSFHETIHAIQTGNYAQAASRMLQSLWARQVGHRATEDAAIMRSGHLAGGGGTGVAGGGGGGNHSHGTSGHSGGGGGGGGGVIAEVRDGQALIKMGDHGPAVTKIQRLLHVDADGIFGPHTLHAVETFQQAHHLEVDGIVGPHTLHALEHKPADKPKHHGGGGVVGGGGETGGVAAPPAHHGSHGGGGGDAHGKWTPAPPLADIESGKAILHEGEKGGSVRHVQKLLGVDTDGEFGHGTRAAVIDFQHEHHMQRHDGMVDAHTLHILTKHPAGSLAGESHGGSAQRSRMLSIARSASEGKRPDGRCYAHVCQFLIACGGYGKIKNPFNQFPSSALPLAHDFADLMNSHGPKRFGLERLSISSPYDAPSGSIVVVKAGSPGTHHPTAGDIAIADGHGNFFNGGMMGYGGPSVWNASPRAKLLGCYVPV